MKATYLFKLKFGKREHILRAYLNEKNKQVFTKKEAVKVENSNGEIFPYEDVDRIDKRNY